MFDRLLAKLFPPPADKPATLPTPPTDAEIDAALQSARYSVAKAARLLSVTEGALYRRLNGRLKWRRPQRRVEPGARMNGRPVR